jgi:hypothetical protein
MVTPDKVGDIRSEYGLALRAFFEIRTVIAECINEGSYPTNDELQRLRNARERLKSAWGAYFTAKGDLH